jgi:hypothetical protein
VISNCPKCAGQVTMPGDGKADWQVKCPLCDQQFSLGEMLEKLPPALIVISAPSAVAARADDEFATLFAGEAERGAGGDIFELDTGAGEAPSFTVAGEQAGSGVATASSVSTVTALPRRKKKEKNVVAELAKIVLGGVAGLLIGFFLLLWVWKKDILGVAPNFPEWAQWALPADLRKAAPSVTPVSSETADAGKEEQKTAEDSAKEPGSEATDVVPETEKPKDPVDGSDEAAAKKEIETRAADPDLKPSDTKTDDTAKKEKPAEKDDPFDLRPADAEKKTDLPKLEEPKLEDALKPKTPAKEETPDDEKKPADADKPDIKDLVPDITDEKKPAEKKPEQPKTTDDAPETDAAKPDTAKPDAAADVGLKIAEKSTPEQVETALTAAGDAEKVLTPQDAAQKSAFTPEKYAAFAKVCEAVAAVARATDDVRSPDKLKVLVLLVTSDDEHATVLGQMANAWLTRSRKNDGIVLAGKVEEVSGEGPLKTVKVQLPARGEKLPAVQVTVLAKDLPELKPQDPVNVTGVIVEKPADDIKGYKGENKPVVWATDVTKRMGGTP